MGKGTAIKGNADIDLVLILNEVKSAEDLKTKLPSIQGKIIHLLKENSRRLAILPETIKPTSFHVKFSVNGTYENIDVDLLPSFHFSGTYKYLNVVRISITFPKTNTDILLSTRSLISIHSFPFTYFGSLYHKIIVR